MKSKSNKNILKGRSNESLPFFFIFLLIFKNLNTLKDDQYILKIKYRKRWMHPPLLTHNYVSM